jgi:HD-like signal output (HDOD) protein
MDKLEVSQKKLGKVTEERDKALLNLAQLRQYVEELQKVCLRENAP